MTACVCAPGPVGGPGWRSDCPAHNVRALLAAPPSFDPTTLTAKLADLGLTITPEGITTMNHYSNGSDPAPADYTAGLGETVRAARSYIGISQRGLARRLKMDRRSYQRIEADTTDCPPGLLDSLEAVIQQFDSEVDEVVSSAAKRYNAFGLVSLEVTDDPADEWTRAVVARATVMAGGWIIRPVLTSTT